MTSAREKAPPFVSRVRIRGFRSIADCDVDLGPLTVLAGFNAAGKSNFLDAMDLSLKRLPGRLAEHCQHGVVLIESCATRRKQGSEPNLFRSSWT
ncbi:AAA family ATPase [Nonomuraea sp. K274]|uniref:AAA family ATPase n=1 Tax=Nonomuraea cypriaca TaxID=1187855 RepID=A0A931AGI7_9ACTN|nr:AAA family ATPase [Nonomuraea cypriaca]